MKPLLVFVALVSSLVSWAAAAQATSIVLSVDEPGLAGQKDVPVTTGLPLAKGVLKSVDTVRELDAAGKPVPAQVGVLSKWWTDESIRALALDFQADLDDSGKALMRRSSSGGSRGSCKAAR